MSQLLRPFGGQICVIGLLLVPISAFMFFMGNNSAKRHAQFDAESESVTLENFAAGNYTNRRWFHISEFQSCASDQCGFDQLIDSDDASTVLVPLWPRSVSPQSGPAPVVARIKTNEQVSTEDATKWLDRQKSLNVQCWNSGDIRIRVLQRIAPAIWRQGAKLIEVNATPPTMSRAWGFRLWGSLWAALATLCLGYTALVTLGLFGGSNRSRRPQSELLPVRAETDSATSAPLTPAARTLATEFERSGFQPAGMLRRQDGRVTTNHHMFLSEDQRVVLDIVETKKFSRAYLFGVCDDATLLSLGSGADGLDINGSQFKIPICAFFVTTASPEAMISGFHRIHEQLCSGHPLVRIGASEAGNVRCYYDRLIEWWMFTNGMTQTTPEPVPAADELIQHHDGVIAFCWQTAGLTEPAVAS